MNQLNDILNKLGINKSNGLTLLKDVLSNKNIPDRIRRIFSEEIKPDAVFCLENKPIVLFFEHNKLSEINSKQIWNLNETPIVFSITQTKISIYNGFKFISERNSLEELDTSSIFNDFNYVNLMTGNIWKTYQKYFNSKSRVDECLLENIKYARRLLIEKLDDSSSEELSNSLLGKIIFIRYLIDRKVKLNYKDKSKYWTNDDLCDLLRSKEDVGEFFKYLKQQFNGNLFTISENEFNKISDECLNILIELLKGTELKNNQQSLFDVYDFSIIPIEFISNIYELFIGKNKQEKSGSYYTPIFLVDNILTDVLDKNLPKTFSNNVFKVLDPACGSGIFLVESLRRIIEKYRQFENIHIDSSEIDVNLYKSTLKQLAIDNIFGIDKDKNAVNVAIFSICLTLLDYQNPSEIETFVFPNLLNENFFVADFFDITHKYNQKLSEIKFSLIVGNPPWGVKSNSSSFLSQYITKNTMIANKEIAQAFVIRVRDFLCIDTQCAFVLPSKTFYNLNAHQFRKFILNNYLINKVFELSSVKKELFNKSNDPAHTPATILFFKLPNSLDQINSNVVQHISLKPSLQFSILKIFIIYRKDFKEIKQSKFFEFDFLWKILLYGTYMDFLLIQRIKNKYKTIGDIINSDSDFISGQGLQVSGGDKNDISDLQNFNFVDARRDIMPFIINSQLQKWSSGRTAHRDRDRNLYNNPPMLLVRKGVQPDLHLVAALCQHKAVFKDAVSAIAVSLNCENRNKKIDILKSILGIMNSSIMRP